MANTCDHNDCKEPPTVSVRFKCDILRDKLGRPGRYCDEHSVTVARVFDVATIRTHPEVYAA